MWRYILDFDELLKWFVSDVCLHGRSRSAGRTHGIIGDESAASVTSGWAGC